MQMNISMGQHNTVSLHINALCFQPDQDEGGGWRYSETSFTLSDINDPWIKQGNAHCPELSV